MTLVRDLSDGRQRSADSRPRRHQPAHGLGDFLTSPRLLLMSLLAIGVGTTSAFVALGLLRLIGLFTNLFFFQR